MRNVWGGKLIVAGIAGAVVGALAEALVNRVAGRVVIVEGMMWGAVLAILLISLPNFGQMGRLVVKGDRPVVHFLVGIAVFVVISMVLMTLFFNLLGHLARKRFREEY